MLLQNAHLSDATRFTESSSYLVFFNVKPVLYIFHMICDLRFIINTCSISSFVNSSPVLFFHFVVKSIILFVLPLFFLLYSLLTPVTSNLMIVFRKVLTGPTSYVSVLPIDLVYLVMEVLINLYSREFVCIPYISLNSFNLRTSVFSDTTSPI